ncbi:MAG TPA: helix-turn-helix transcriptional regulator [Allosphingosinicella sp.]|jgi:AraC-like DNA-binding protein
MIYREHALPPAARAAAFCAWRFAMEPGDPETVLHSVPPDGTGNLLLVLGPDGTQVRRLVGPSVAVQSGPIHAGWLYAGLRLRPECVASVTGRDPATLVGTSEDMEGLDPLFAALARLAADEPDWALGAAEAEWLGLRRGDAAVAHAVDRLIASGGTAPIAAAAAAAGLSPRQLRRRFAAATGLSPKQYSGVQRVRRALILSLDTARWADVAAEAGYADQPHLNRAVRTHFGTAPRTIGFYVGGIRHVFVEQSASEPGAAPAGSWLPTAPAPRSGRRRP